MAFNMSLSSVGSSEQVSTNQSNSYFTLLEHFNATVLANIQLPYAIAYFVLMPWRKAWILLFFLTLVMD